MELNVTMDVELNSDYGRFAALVGLSACSIGDVQYICTYIHKCIQMFNHCKLGRSLVICG
jgi:hypothetical protein